MLEQNRLDKEYEQIFHAAGLGIERVSLIGKFLDVNEKLCSMMQYTKEELLQLSFQDITHSDDLAIDLKYHHELLDGKIENFNLEKRCIRKDGVCIWVNVSATLVLNEDDSPDFFVRIVEDITDKVIARDEFLELKQKLEAKEQLLNTIMNEILSFLL